MTGHDTLRCNEVMIWLLVMSDGEATKLVAPHLAGCSTCRRGRPGLARLTRWVSRFRVGATPTQMLTLAIAGWCARMTAARMS